MTKPILPWLTHEHICKFQEEKVDSSLEFLILASDGLWDVVSNEVKGLFDFLNSPFKNLPC